MGKPYHTALAAFFACTVYTYILNSAFTANDGWFTSKATWTRSDRLCCAGKNRPLDEDELDFVNDILERERRHDHQVAADEVEQLDAYREVRHSAYDQMGMCSSMALAHAAWALPARHSIEISKNVDIYVPPFREHSCIHCCRSLFTWHIWSYWLSVLVTATQVPGDTSRKAYCMGQLDH